jgi:hypothetical protein
MALNCPKTIGTLPGVPAGTRRVMFQMACQSGDVGRCTPVRDPFVGLVEDLLDRLLATSRHLSSPFDLHQPTNAAGCPGASVGNLKF